MARHETAYDSRRSRVITQEVLKADGTVKYRVGEVKDFPVAVWRDIARSLGKDLSEFTQPTEEFAANAARRPSPAPANASRSRQRLDA